MLFFTMNLALFPGIWELFLDLNLKKPKENQCVWLRTLKNLRKIRVFAFPEHLVTLGAPLGGHACSVAIKTAIFKKLVVDWGAFLCGFCVVNRLGALGYGLRMIVKARWGCSVFNVFRLAKIGPTTPKKNISQTPDPPPKRHLLILPQEYMLIN